MLYRIVLYWCYIIAGHCFFCWCYALDVVAKLCFVRVLYVECCRLIVFLIGSLFFFASAVRKMLSVHRVFYLAPKPCFVLAQVRKLAMGTRMKRFRELLPGLNADKLFKDFPQVVMMDLKKVTFIRFRGRQKIGFGQLWPALVSFFWEVLTFSVVRVVRVGGKKAAFGKC